MSEVVTPTGSEVKSTIEVGNGMKQTYTVDYYSSNVRILIGDVLIFNVDRKFVKPTDRSMELAGFMVSGGDIQAVGHSRDIVEAWPENTDLKFVFSDKVQAPHTENGTIKVPFSQKGYLRVDVKDRGRSFHFAPHLATDAEKQSITFTVSSRRVS